MMLQSSNRSILARELGLEEGAEIPRRGVAALLRSALARWGLSPRRALTRYARQQLEAVHFLEQPSATVVREVLDHLHALRECDAVIIGGERYVAPGYPRWIRTGTHTATLLGVNSVPEEVSLLTSNARDIVRRVRIHGEQDLVMLNGGGFEECSFESWLRPLHYLRHQGRRLGHPVREDHVTLRDLWDTLVEAVTAEGRALAGDADLRVLAGTPGGYFGRYNAPECEGRWTTGPEDGVWCGFRRGYGDNHWHPVVVAIDGAERRLVDLFDHDEWKWALLARAQATGVREVVRESDNALEYTMPLPNQVATAMDLIGPRASAWKWEIPEGVTRFWSDFV